MTAEGVNLYIYKENGAINLWADMQFERGYMGNWGKKGEWYTYHYKLS